MHLPRWAFGSLWRSWLFFVLVLGGSALGFVLGPKRIQLSVEQLLLINELLILIGLLYATWPCWNQPQAFGLKRFAPRILLFGIAGLVCIYLLGGLYGVLVNALGAEPSSQVVQIYQATDNKWVFFLVAAVMAPVLEELFFRGYLFTGLCRYLPWRVAATVTAVLFAAIHFDLYRAPLLAMIGYLLAWLYQRSGSLWPSIILHSINNLMALSLLHLISQ